MWLHVLLVHPNPFEDCVDCYVPSYPINQISSSKGYEHSISSLTYKRELNIIALIVFCLEFISYHFPLMCNYRRSRLMVANMDGKCSCHEVSVETSRHFQVRPGGAFLAFKPQDTSACQRPSSNFCNGEISSYALNVINRILNLKVPVQK